MNKKLIVLGLLFISLFFFAGTASAQSTSPLILTANLKVGSSGSQVVQLQNFLINGGYLRLPVGINTGYFGSLTKSAVANFQKAHNISPSLGNVGPLTRGVLASISFSNSSSISGSNGSNSQNLFIDAVTAPATLNVNEMGTWTVHASSIRASSFTDNSLTYSVRWGDNCQSNPAPYTCDIMTSPFQKSSTFTHSYSRAGTYTQTFTVKNSAGESAETTTTVKVGDSVNGCSGNPSSSALNSCNTISLNPTSGPVGTQVTITAPSVPTTAGPIFTATGNTVNFGDGVVRNLPSNYGASLTFTVPSELTPGCHYLTPPCGLMSRSTLPGVYPVSVTNSNGVTSSAGNFTVTSTSNNGLVISSVTAPTNLSTNQTGTWTVHASSNTASSNPNDTLSYAVNWGDSFFPMGACFTSAGNPCPVPPLPAPVFQQSPTFSHAYTLDGNYTQTFTVKSNSGQQTQTTTSVKVGTGGSTGLVAINSLSPISAAVGAEVIIYGSGFTETGNNVNFAGGIIPGTFRHPQETAPYVSFTVPSSVVLGNCGGNMNNTVSATCIGYVRDITAGTYPVLVTNSRGTSNSLNLMVTGGQNNNTPSITSLSPSSGPVGTSVTLNGNNLGASQGSAVLEFYRLGGDIVLEYHPTIQSWSNNQIRFTVPSSAPYIGDVVPANYTVKIYTGVSPYAYSNGATFTVTSNTSNTPIISSISPTSGPVGGNAALIGSGLYAGTIHFGSINIPFNPPPSAGTDASFAIPQIAQGTYPVSITTQFGTSNNDHTFTVTPNTSGAPVISFLDFPSGQVGSLVTVYGRSFSSTGNTVQIGSATRTNLVSSTGTSTAFIVPQLAVGNYTMTLTNYHGTSNSFPFTVSPIPPTFPFPPPTAELTVNGSSDVTVNVGDAVQYNWRSHYGGIFRSSYTTDCNPGVTASWEANTGSGNSLRTIAAEQAGCTYTITYTVDGAAGRATATMIIRVRGSGQTSAPTISSLTPTQGSSGTSVTLNGTGLYGSTVKFGTITVPTTLSQGNSASFIVPSGSFGVFPVSMTTSGGTSNSVNFTVNYSQTGAPSITSLTPTQGSSGTSVTLTGSGLFGSSVHFGTITVPTSAYQGNSATFIVPSGSFGVFPVSMTTSGGTSNSINFTVNYGQTSAPTTSFLTPSSGSNGTNITVYGSHFTSTGNSVHFGTGGVYFNYLTSGGDSITFPLRTDGYDTEYCIPNAGCSYVAGSTLPSGSYPISVRNANGISDAHLSFNLTGGTQTSAPHITSISPTSGSSGRLVTLYGSGFSTGTVHFGTQNIMIAVNGSNDYTIPISFSVPNSIAPGTYLVSYSTGAGTSNSINFTVTAATADASTNSQTASVLDSLNSLIQQASGNNLTAAISNSINALLINLKSLWPAF